MDLFEPYHLRIEKTALLAYPICSDYVRPFQCSVASTYNNINQASLTQAPMAWLQRDC